MSKHIIQESINSWKSDNLQQELEVGTVSASIVVVRALIDLSKKLYHDYLNKAAGACKSKPIDDRATCIIKFKIKALDKQITNLRKNSSKCNKTKKPVYCKKQINGEIKKLKEKIKKLKNKL